jgi:hypothetical protein
MTPELAQVFPEFAADVVDMDCQFKIAFPSDASCGWDSSGAPFPLVGLMHGAGQSYLGYDYLHEHLAANRIVSTSFSNFFIGGPSLFEANGLRFTACMRAVLDPDPGRVTQNGPDLWTPGDAAHLERRLGLAGHSQGNPPAFFAAKAFTKLRNEMVDAASVAALLLIGPRRPFNSLEELGDFPLVFEDAPTVLVIDVSRENQVPRNAQPYYDFTGTEESVTGGSIATRAMLFIIRGVHNAFDTTTTKGRSRCATLSSTCCRRGPCRCTGGASRPGPSSSRISPWRESDRRWRASPQSTLHVGCASTGSSRKAP